MKALIPRLKIIEEIAQENTRSAQATSKVIHDRKAEQPKFKIGDKVYLQNMKRRVGISPKLERIYVGPYIITQCGSKDSFKLRHAVTDKLLQNSVHADRLRMVIPFCDGFYSKVKAAEEREKLRREAQSAEARRATERAKETSAVVPGGTRNVSDPETQDPVMGSRRASPSTSDERAISEVPHLDTPAGRIDPVVVSQDARLNPPEASQASKQSLTKDNASGWYNVKKLLRRKKIAGKNYFEVLWEDDTKSWQISSNVCDFAKKQYYEEFDRRRQENLSRGRQRRKVEREV